MDPDVFPNTIEYWGPVGMAFFRNPQIRWTPIDNEGIRFAVAVESPGSALDQGKVDTDDLSDFGEDFSDWNQYPDFTTHVRGDFDWGHIQLAGIVRVLGYEIRSNDGEDPDGAGDRRRGQPERLVQSLRERQDPVAGGRRPGLRQLHERRRHGSRARTTTSTAPRP